MGERTDEITGYEPDETITPVYSAASGNPGDPNDADATEAARANIEHTRNEMSQTVNAIQEKLNPQQLMEQAKNTVVDTATQLIDRAKESATETVDHTKEAVQETAAKVVGQAKESATETVDQATQSVHDATIGKVEHMVSNISDTAQQTGSGIVDTIKNNPIPAAAIGLGLGWLFLKGQNKSSSNPRPQTAQTVGPMTRSSVASSYYSAPYAAQTPVSSQSLTSQMINSVRENPIPAAVAGLGLGYMVMQGQNAGKAPSGSASYGGQSQAGIGQKVGDLTSQATDKMEEVTHKAGDLVGTATDKAGEVAGGVVSTVGDIVGGTASGVGDIVGGAASGVQTQAQNVENQFERWFQQNPLMVGVAALSLGMAVGYMLPGTQPENDLLGEARNEVMGKAQETLQQTFEKVQHVGQEMSDTAKDALSNVSDSVKQEAHNQGLIK